MTQDFPDFTRAVALLGIDAEGELVQVLVDSDGNLGAIMKGEGPGGALAAVAVDASGRIVMVPYGTTTVAGTATVTQSEKDREVQGADGETLRTLAVDASGQLVMVPRGQSGAYMSVDASGFLTTILKGQSGEVLKTLQADVDGVLAARLIAWDGADSKYVLTDDAGRIIMVPRGQSGYYMAVDSNGYLGAVLKAAADVNVQGSVPVDQNSAVREVQGAEGANLRTIAVDASGQIIMVPRGQSGNYMSVDASGFLTAVLKGLRAGVLTTIGVDSEGRIEAFGLDAEDQWGQVLRTGNSELAARLGSAVTWDWRGNVLYSCDFSTGYGPCVKVAHGTGASVTLGPEKGGFGGYAVKMTSGSGVDDYAQVNFYVGSNPSVRLGIAARFAISGNTGYVSLFIEYLKGTGCPYGYLRIDVANSQLQIYSAGGEWTNVGAVSVNLSAETYCWLKLVINQSTGYYERGLYNGVEIDLSAYPCPTTTSAYVGSILSIFVNVGRTGYNDVVYLDQLILTVNEPANA